jgi:rod shape-determining protein MreD
MLLTEDYIQSIKISFIRLLTILWIVFSCISLKIAGLSHIIPAFDIIFIFYWTIYYPAIFPFWFIIVISCILDILQGMPFSVSSLVNVIFQITVIMQKRFFIKNPFIVVWFGFILFSLGSCALKWIILSALKGEVIILKAVIIQWLFTLAAYPWVHLLFHNIYLLLVNRKKI